MEKTVTKEQVERVLSVQVWDNPELEKKILNELFPSFKVGDWVVGWHCDDKMVRHLSHGAWQIANIKSDGSIIAVDDVGYSTSSEHLRHATPEEIAAAEWEEGKPYRVDVFGGIVLISSDKVGRFYKNCGFDGETEKHDKYEKL